MSHRFSEFASCNAVCALDEAAHLGKGTTDAMTSLAMSLVISTATFHIGSCSSLQSGTCNAVDALDETAHIGKGDKDSMTSLAMLTDFLSSVSHRFLQLAAIRNLHRRGSVR